MTDIAQLEKVLLAAIASSKDEAALEAVRIAALGKNGSVSALLKTLGTMTPDERKAQGPAINGLKDRVSAAITAAKPRPSVASSSSIGVKASRRCGSRSTTAPRVR